MMGSVDPTFKAGDPNFKPGDKVLLIDGKSRGVSPPLRTLDIPPGSHTIELRNSTFPSHVEKLDVKPGEAVRIRYRFGKKK